VIRLIPTHVMEEHRVTAKFGERRPVSRSAALAIVGIWTFGAVALMLWLSHLAVWSFASMNDGCPDGRRSAACRIAHISPASSGKFAPGLEKLIAAATLRDVDGKSPGHN